MKRLKNSKLLVIDASVAGRSGDKDAMDPGSKQCRDFLEVAKTICHRIVLTDWICDEWNAHQSGSARRWRVQMIGMRKLDRRDNVAIASIRARIARLDSLPDSREEVMKDLPLIEACLQADKIIVSCDDKARRAFVAIADDIIELKKIAWVNPEREAEKPIEWLKGGARRDRKRLLGS